MDSNSHSQSVSDKEGSVAEMEHGVILSDIEEVEVSLERGGDKPTRDESAAEFERVGKTLTIDSNSGTDKEGSLTVQTEHKFKVIMSKVDQGAAVGDKPNCEENSDANNVAQLIQSRQEALKQKKMARRAAWQEEVKAELEKRAEKKRQMEGSTRKQITDWKDKQIFSKISVQARKAFRSERTQFLIYEVLPIISQHRITRWNITFDEILNCRLVSKPWKDAIDTWLSNTSPLYQQLFFEDPTLILQNSESGCLKFGTAKQLQSFNRKSAQEYQGMNPFPFRQLYIGDLFTLLEGYGNLGFVYWIEMEKLLDLWGKEIWATVFVYDEGSIEMMYEFLIKYLRLMPNLRELAILERDRSQNLGADMLKSLGKDVLGPLKLRMERKPLPELPHLRSVILGNLTPAPLIDAVLAKYGDALQTVKVEGPGFDKYSGEYVDLGQFVAGRELPFTYYSSLLEDCSRIAHWNFQFPALNELRLDYLNVKEGAEVANIFKTVNSVGSTIRRLRLKIMFNVPDPKRKTDFRDLMPRGVKLELPHLEWFDLTVERSKIKKFDFLLPLVSLKEMDLYYFTMSSSVASAKDGPGILQFAGYRDRFYDSNIWTFLPELKLLRIYSIPIRGPSTNYLRWREPDLFGVIRMITTVHTRDGYRHHQRGIQLLTEQLAALTAK